MVRELDSHACARRTCRAGSKAGVTMRLFEVDEVSFETFGFCQMKLGRGFGAFTAEVGIGVMV